MLEHPRAKSHTTSSKFGTSSPTGADTPVQFVKGVGPGLGRCFESRGIRTVRDLFWFFPRAYQDRSQIKQISELVEDQSATINGSITGVQRIPIRRRRGKFYLQAKFQDESGTVSLKWFHLPYGLESRIRMGAQLIVTGKPKRYQNRLEIIHPEITAGSAANDSESSAHFGRIVPIYSEIDGVSTRILRKVMFNAIEKYGGTVSEDIPETLRNKYHFVTMRDAIQHLHFPRSTDDLDVLNDSKTPYHHRLIFEEFFKFQYFVLQKQNRLKRERCVQLDPKMALTDLNDLRTGLPFDLTGDQKSVMAEILDDFNRPYPANRLVQGDVGSGKTAVVLLASGIVCAQGYQAALMAPTEILAEQHYQNVIRFFGGKISTHLLTGSSTQKERDEILGRLASGEPCLVVGTHALIEESVVFKNLALITIDEQHRFGVEQRKKLTEKGKVRPHNLVLSATPIPRTLALTVYGDLSLSTIREKPPGRQPVKTFAFTERNRHQMIDKVREKINEGRQVYMIYPLVNESESEQFASLKSAVIEAERLNKEVFPEYKVGLLHGRMSGDEKNLVMEEFKRGKTQILVSTTVVEVGVDVPNATVMVVENSERFGLSQLHQLRGRVGRGAHESYCFLMTKSSAGELSRERLAVLERTEDGFEIAQVDLEMRGPGEFLGTRQSGDLPFRVANIVRDQQLLMLARNEAQALLEKDPKLEAQGLTGFRRYLSHEGKRDREILMTS